MIEEIKELQNNPEKAVYQIGKDKNALILSVEEVTENGEVKDINLEPLAFSEKFLKLNLSKNNIPIYALSELEDSRIEPSATGFHLDRAEAIANLSRKLFNDKSKNARYAKEFLKKISGNPLIDEIKEQIKVVEEEQKRELNNSKLGCVRAKLAKKLGIKTELPKSIKKIEKVISGTILGKTRE